MVGVGVGVCVRVLAGVGVRVSVGSGVFVTKVGVDVGLAITPTFELAGVVAIATIGAVGVISIPPDCCPIESSCETAKTIAAIKRMASPPRAI